MAIPIEWNLLPVISLDVSSLMSDGLLIGHNNQYGNVDIKCGAGQDNTYVLLYRDNMYGGTYVYRGLYVSTVSNAKTCDIWRPSSYSDAFKEFTLTYTRGNFYYIGTSTGVLESLGIPVPVYASYNSAISSLDTATLDYPITYRDTNATHSGPVKAAIGDTVTVEYTFPDGYGIVNSSDIYVTNNGVLVPSTYANGTLTFTMPDPS